MNREELEYFKKRNGYHRIFQAIREKYRSLGRIGGVVKIDNLRDDEKEILMNHLKKDYSKKKSANIDVAKFEESLKYTRFDEYTLIEILEHYFGEKLTSKKEDLDEFIKQREEFFNELFSKYDGFRCIDWLKSLYNGTAVGIRSVNQRYIKDKDALKTDIMYVCHALNNLPVYKGEKKRLPVFASQITRNPHSFDLCTECGSVLKNALCTIMGMDEVKGAEEIAELYYSAGILIDEISNSVTLSGLTAYNGDKENHVFRAAYENKEVLQIPLLNLSKIDRVISPLKKVYVVENPGVFTSLIDAAIELPPLVCTYGQPKLSSLIVLDMLYKEGTEIYYSGDFDPEGLQIADRLCKRYKDKFHFLRYSVEDYLNALSSEGISNMRLAKLNKIESPELYNVIKEMRKIKKAGYQELILNELIGDIKQEILN
jgi:uncharacterized protein (TIGR02679 family)